MADFQARREARMRRIMESSEDRMKRLLGTTHRTDEPVSRNDGEDQDTSSGSKVNEEIPATSSVNSDNEGNTIEKNPLEMRQRRIPQPEDGSRKNLNTVKISPLKNTSPALSSPVRSTTANESLTASKSSSKDAKMMLKHFEFLRIVLCFLVAFVCRKILSTGYGIFYIETIFIPFLCLEIGFFTFKRHVLHNVMLPHRSSMLVGLLMLCGLRTNVVQTYNKIMGYSTAAGEDFAMYTFAFMMSHVVAS